MDHSRVQPIIDNIRRVYLGDPQAVTKLVCCMLARGHALIEDVPGVGKTVLATAMARSVNAPFARVQFTPDMLPADILGVSIYEQSAGKFIFKKGPIFTSVLLADEINRATPRTQAALLEAMAEAQVSVDGVTHALPSPFMVLATQNPRDFAGAYQLPENQLDRFLMRVHLGYPTPQREREILALRPAQRSLPDLSPVLDAGELIELQKQTDEVRIADSLLDYIVAIATATREHEGLRLGLSPRGALALAQAARASAFTQGRDYAIPEDILDMLEPVCAHRIAADGAGVGESDAANEALREVRKRVPSPI